MKMQNCLYHSTARCVSYNCLTCTLWRSPTASTNYFTMMGLWIYNVLHPKCPSVPTFNQWFFICPSKQSSIIISSRKPPYPSQVEWGAIAQYFYNDQVFQLSLNCFALIYSYNWLPNSLWASWGKWPYLKHLGAPNILQRARHKKTSQKVHWQLRTWFTFTFIFRWKTGIWCAFHAQRLMKLMG